MYEYVLYCTIRTIYCEASKVISAATAQIFFSFSLLYVSTTSELVVVHVCVAFWLLLPLLLLLACCLLLAACFTCSAAFVRDLLLLLLPRTRNPVYLIWLAFTATQTVICYPTALLPPPPISIIPSIAWCILPELADATLLGRNALSPETLVLSWPADFRVVVVVAAALEDRR